MRHSRASRWIPLGVVALSLAGCADGSRAGSPAAPSSIASGLAPGVAATSRPLALAPFKGSDSGTFEFTQDTCAPGLAPLRTHTAGTGTLVGAYAFDTIECFDTETLTFSGSFTIVAANGDALSGPYEGYITGFLDSATSTSAFTATVTGGTGRFANAAGRFSGTGQASLATFQEARTFSGSVSGISNGQP